MGFLLDILKLIFAYCKSTLYKYLLQVDTINFSICTNTVCNPFRREGFSITCLTLQNLVISYKKIHVKVYNQSSYRKFYLHTQVCYDLYWLLMTMYLMKNPKFLLWSVDLNTQHHFQLYSFWTLLFLFYICCKKVFFLFD